MTYSLQHFLILSTAVFLIGFLGVLINRKSIISILLSIELMLLAVSINFVAFSSHLNQITGQVFSIFILAIAAAESAIALAIIVLYFKNRNTINVKDINELQG
jgi:NADH-quinone oxidoreductase subunit K